MFAVIKTLISALIIVLVGEASKRSSTLAALLAAAAVPLPPVPLVPRFNTKLNTTTSLAASGSRR